RATLGDRTPRLRDAGLWARAPVLATDPRAWLAPPPSPAGPVDGAAQAVPGLPPLRSRGLARLGRQPGGGAAGRCRRPRRTGPDRVCGLAFRGVPSRQRPVA